MIRLRNKIDADEFLSYEIEQWDEFAKKYPMPEILSEKKVKVEFVLWKRKRKIFIVSDTNEDASETTFYRIHPSSIGFKYFENYDVDSISEE